MMVVVGVPGSSAWALPAAVVGGVAASPAVVPELEPPVGGTASALAEHIARSRAAYPVDEDRSAIFDFDASRCLDTTTAWSSRHQSAQLVGASSALPLPLVA